MMKKTQIDTHFFFSISGGSVSNMQHSRVYGDKCKSLHPSPNIFFGGAGVGGYKSVPVLQFYS